MRTRQILCPTDFSETASHALKYAIEMANLYHVNIRLLHVMSDMFGQHDYGIVVEAPVELDHQVENFSREKLTALAAEIDTFLDGELRVIPVLRSGDVMSQVIEESIEQDVGMIVVASHGHTGLSHLLNPNVAEAITNKAKCPVLVVK
ncbi:universal stress protein [Shewanella sp. D64]|uniref:universal stress protein n=1 Tax=unclassified Shewanella TaxID=196818 RepID=UPI0022BA2484|nr:MULTISPECIES: universal stress protein [unclassified Shewanella]MEC4725079.1 universal stress protein [Shewanella sp. D64]MEC4736980.1 universal stress protein [Shewanella sp. E94]WBJ96571.1 universal stress protein [Shewanella sp. MTB7]